MDITIDTCLVGQKIEGKERRGGKKVKEKNKSFVWWERIERWNGFPLGPPFFPFQIGRKREIKELYKGIMLCSLPKRVML